MPRVLPNRVSDSGRGPHTNSGRFTDLDADKLRGGYYTPHAIAAWLAQWAIRSPQDNVLEPSCGDGVFLSVAVRRFAELGASNRRIAKQLTGIEIISAEADCARRKLIAHVGNEDALNVINGDFFEWWERPARQSFDAVIGNPPFIRYQTFPEPHRSRAIGIMNRLELAPNKLTNIWVPFVVAAASALRPGGRLALVLPAELLQVSYASQLRSFLTDRFTRIDIVACNELFFAKAQQEVVLLLADGALAQASSANMCRVALTEGQTLDDIVSRAPFEVVGSTVPKAIRHDQEKWLKYFLSEREITFMRELRSGGAAANLKVHADVDVGVVTGKNEFFVLTTDRSRELGVTRHTIPLVSRSAHLRGARIGAPEWEALAATQERVHLLHLTPMNGARLSGVLARYVEQGEKAEIHKGYKCSIRTPWYAVPSVWIPQAFMFRQIYDFPRVVLNKAGATSTDTIHRMMCKSKPEFLIANLYTHLTAASAEIEGRSYGGGVLELEPTEAERLLVPRCLADAIPIGECDRLIRAGCLDEILIENDRCVLREGMGLSKAECTLLRSIWTRMRDRRRIRKVRRTTPSSHA